MSVNYKLSSVTFSGGDEISFDQDSTILIVGPNNSGKSCFLREIFNVIQNGNTQTKAIRKVINEISFLKEGSRDDFQNYISDNTQKYTKPDGQTFIRSLKVDVHENTATQRWSNSHDGFHESSSLICTHADTLSRLTAANPPNAINFLTETGQHPIHEIHQNDKLEKKLSSHLKIAFGEELILNRGAGAILPLHIGKNPEKENGEDRVSSGYIKKLSGLPLVNEQGDGIRSFIGCLLSTVVMPRFITLLDEPEAFLHPPQARHLGALLVTEHHKNQLILATHSGDIVRGILDANTNNLNILRITRKENKNYVSKLNSSDIKSFWSDPILRFSNILDSLFHEGTVICESDTDCRFYSSVLSAIHDNSPENQRKPDLFFASSGGKNRIATIARSLVKIKMDTYVIVDFDILFEKERIKEIYEILGGSWAVVESDYNAVKKCIDKKSNPVSTSDVCNLISTELTRINESGIFNESDRQKIRDHMKSSKALQSVKENGMDIFSEDDQETLERLLATFKKSGLYIVPCGEIESFDKSTLGHGTNWVARVLEKDILNDPSLKRARDFVSILSKK